MNTFVRVIRKCVLLWVISSFLLIATTVAQGLVTYELTFTSTWSRDTHPTNFPSGPHFSFLIGGTHNSSVNFWTTGQTASNGIRQMAERGWTSILQGEVQQAINASNAYAVIRGGGIGHSPGSVKKTFTIHPSWSLVTVTSMLAPSPDWFVGVSGLNLLDENNNWIQRHEVELFVYDAGTDSGSSYHSDDVITDPRENIRRIETSPFLVDGAVKSVGTFVFELQAPPEVTLSAGDTSVEEGDPVTVSVKLSKALTSDVTIPLILTPGTAESDDYDPVSPVNVTIAGGTTEVDHTINTNEDSDTRDETFTVAIDTGNLPSDVTAGSTISQEITITDPDVPEVSLSVKDNSVAEGEPVTVTVSLTEDLASNITISLTLTAGTAESDDYDAATPVNVTIPGGTTEVDHTMNTYEDGDTKDETFTITIDTGNLPADVTAGSAISEEITITDPDVPEASISVDQQAVEEGESVTVTVMLSEDLTSNITIPLLLTAGTAESDDYDSISPVNVIITGGATQTETVIRTMKDSDTKDETFTVAIDTGNLPADVTAGRATSQEITITDPDVPDVSLSVDQQTVEEGESVTVTIMLSEDLTSNITIPLLLTAGTAESDDYDSTSPVNVTIASSATQIQKVIKTNPDDDSDDETFTITIDADNLPADVKAGTALSEVIRITDPDRAQVSLSVDHQNVDEGESVTVTVSLSQALTSEVTIPIQLIAGTAESDDYADTSPVNLNFAIGQIETDYVITTKKDDDPDHETFTIAVDTDNLPAGITAGSPRSVAVTITDLDISDVSLSVDDSSVAEGESVTVTVALSQAQNSEVTIPLILTSETAESNDYDSTSPRNLNLASGQTRSELVIATYVDADTEDESFTVTINEDNLPPGVILGNPSSESITITDTTVPEVRLSIEQTMVLEGMPVTGSIELSTAQNADIAITLILTAATAESDDYDRTSPLSLKIPARQNETAFTIRTFNDSDFEDEDFTISIDGDNLPTGIFPGSPSSADITIKDSSIPKVSLSVNENSIAEGDSVVVTLELPVDLDSDIGIPLILTPGTAESDDYDHMSPVSIEIIAGQTEGEYTIQTFEDADTEHETFTISIDGENLPVGILLGSPASIEIKITDNDTPGILAPTSVEIDEGQSAEIRVSLMTEPSGNVTMTITGYMDRDLEPNPKTLTFTQTNYNIAQTVTLTTIEDGDLLNDEMTLTFMTSGGGYSVSNTLTVTIRDNRGVHVEADVSPTSITLRGNYPNPVSGRTNIEFDLPEPAQIAIRVTDLLGRIVQTTPYGWFEVGKGHAIELDTGNLTSGVYYYTLTADMEKQRIQRSKSMSIVK